MMGGEDRHCVGRTGRSGSRGEVSVRVAEVAVPTPSLILTLSPEQDQRQSHSNCLCLDPHVPWPVLESKTRGFPPCLMRVKFSSWI